MMPQWKRTGAWALLVLSLLPAAAFAYRYRAMPHFGFLLDDAIYVTTAKSMAEGGGYRIASLPGTPWQTKYPPGYAWALSWIWSADPRFPGNLRWIVVFGGLSLAACVFLARRVGEDLGLPPGWATAAAALCALNAPAVFYASSAMSDIPAMALLLICFVLAHQAAVRRCVWLALAAGVAAGAGYLTRSAFLVLLAAGPLWFLWKRQWRFAAASGGAMLPAVAAWQLWARVHRALEPSPQVSFYVDYLGYLAKNFSAADTLPVAGANFETLVQSMGGLLWFDPDAAGPLALWKTVLTLLAVAGAFQLTRRAPHVYAVFALGYVAVLLPWNFSPNERFVLPLLPLLTAGVMESVRRIVEAMRSVWKRGGLVDRAFSGAAFAALAAVSLLWASAFSEGLSGYMRGLMERERTRIAYDRSAGMWAQAYLGPQPVITYQESRFHLFSGRQAVGMPLPSKTGYRGDRKEITAYFDTVKEVARRHRARYLYTTPWSFELDMTPEERTAWLARIKADPEWTEIFSMNGHSIFELGPGAAFSDKAVQ